MKPQIKISDLETGEVIEREMNDEEYAVWQRQTAEAQQRLEDAQAKELAKAALLEKLGISADEAKLLLS